MVIIIMIVILLYNCRRRRYVYAPVPCLQTASESGPNGVDYRFYRSRFSLWMHISSELRNQEVKKTPKNTVKPTLFRRGLD